MEKYIKIFKALSNKTRLRIFHLLIIAKKELCICEIMDSLDIAQYNVSKQMRILKIAGIVKERKEGKFVFYSIVSENDIIFKNIIKTILQMPEKFFKKDIELLKKRLSLRIKGVCVIGVKKNF